MSMLFRSSSVSGAGAVAADGAVPGGDDAELIYGGRDSSDRSGLHSNSTYTIAAVIIELKNATLIRFLMCATPKCRLR
jgi:hypothetical protein